jgi:predicted metal-binding protein
MRSHADDRRTVVLLCRGCCCGTRAKHPQVDHEAQEQLLETAAEQHPGVELRVVDCLDECDRSNVAVLRRPGAPARERDTWLGGLLTDRAGTALAGWLAAGGDGPLPDALSGLRFRHAPPRRRRGR